ncbi:MAG: hypothetical protein RIA71_08445 [Oceanicaulis sp.]
MSVTAVLASLAMLAAPPAEAQAEPAEQAETSPASTADHHVRIKGDLQIRATAAHVSVGPSIGDSVSTPHATARLGLDPRGRIEIIEGSVDISAIGQSRCNDPRLGLIGTPRSGDRSRLGSVGRAGDRRLENPAAVTVGIGAGSPDALPADPESRR